jgi:hypothetical protein
MATKKLTNLIIDDRLKDRKILRLDDVQYSKTKINWQCLACSYVWQATPNKITIQNTGCPSCCRHIALTDQIVDIRIAHRPLTREDPIQGTNTSIKWHCIDCDHTWVNTPNNVMNKNQGCPKCAGNMTITNQRVDDELNSYNSKLKRIGDYINASTSIDFVCTLCNTKIKINATRVLYNKQLTCRQCSINITRHKHKGGYNQELFNLHPELKTTPARLYVVRASCKNDNFVKVGITTRSIKQRFSSMPYVVIQEIVYEHFTTLYAAFLLEQLILTETHPYKFYTNSKFNGYTECIQDNIVAIENIQLLIANNEYDRNIELAEKQPQPEMFLASC